MYVYVLLIDSITADMGLAVFKKFEKENLFQIMCAGMPSHCMDSLDG